MEQKLFRIALIMIIGTSTSVIAWKLNSTNKTDHLLIYFLSLLISHTGIVLNIEIKKSGNLLSFSLRRFAFSIGALFVIVVLFFFALYLFKLPGIMFGPPITITVYLLSLVWIYSIPTFVMSLLITAFGILLITFWVFLFAPHGLIKPLDLVLLLTLYTSLIFPSVIDFNQKKNTID